MEPAKIDWKALDSVFEVDDLYEHINAPTWVDFSAPDQPLDDESWFCKPDCNHPKTVDDFLKGSPPSKLQRLAATVSEILPSGNRNRRDGNLKRRGLVQPSLSSNKDSKCYRFVEDSENQNPNFSSTPTHQYNNAMKAAMKSSTEKKPIDDSSQREPRPQLKSTLSARNLFAGRDIVNQITEFCNELKRLATRGKERENVERPNEEKSSMAAKKREDNLPGSDERKKERKPLLEVSKEKCESIEKDCVKEKQRRKKWAEDAENIPISVDLKNVKHKEGDSLLQIRTCPPSPQCFSADRGPTKAIPLKASRCKPLERRGILEELKQSNAELKKEEAVERSNQAKMASVVAERGEARSLDVFWFLKPCTLSS